MRGQVLCIGAMAVGIDTTLIIEWYVYASNVSRIQSFIIA